MRLHATTSNLQPNIYNLAGWAIEQVSELASCCSMETVPCVIALTSARRAQQLTTVRICTLLYWALHDPMEQLYLYMYNSNVMHHSCCRTVSSQPHPPGTTRAMGLLPYFSASIAAPKVIDSWPSCRSPLFIIYHLRL